MLPLDTSTPLKSNSFPCQWLSINAQIKSSECLDRTEAKCIFQSQMVERLGRRAINQKVSGSIPGLQ